MAGFDNDVVYGLNVNFSTANATGGNATLLTDGQMLIASTALNGGGTHINVGTLTSPDGSLTIGYSSPNITLQVAGGATTLKTLSDDVNTIVVPAAGNIQLQGHVNDALGKFSTVVAGTNLLKINPMTTARWIVDPLGFNGTHTTISSALSSASSGETIFIMSGTYTENLSLKPGVDLVAFGGDATTPNVTIIGNATLSTAGTVTIANIRLQTNSAAIVTVSGSAASMVNLFGCNLNCTNATGITFSSSSASAKILLNNCYGDLGTTGIAFFAHSSAGNLNIQYSNFTNTGGSSTANTISAGSLNFFYSSIKNPITASGTAAIGFEISDFNTAAQNVTAFTAGGSGSQTVLNASFSSGTASSISISTTLTISQATIDSTNTNAITGAGTINYQDLSFPNTSATINTTTQATAGTLKGSTTTAPTAGFLGERITNTGNAVSLSNNTAANITSISLTPGIWDITLLASFTNTSTTTAFEIAISTTSATLAGTVGDQAAQTNAALSNVVWSLSVPAFRAVVTTNTTYFGVAFTLFSAGTSAVTGRLSAVRVG